MRPVEIADPADPRLDDFRDLTDADVRPDRRGLVIAEGVNVVERLVASPYPVRAVVGVAARVQQLAGALAGLSAPVYVVDKWTLSAVVGFRVTRGVLAAADRLPARDPAELLAASPRVLALEGLNDFENLGALFRNAAAFGVDAVLLDPQCADPLYRRSVRVSMGHALQVPFARLSTPLPDAVEAMRRADPRRAVYALSPAGRLRLREVTPPPRWAVLLGAEGPGLTAAAMAAADDTVRIPMADGVDSLNVATAAAVAMAALTDQTSESRQDECNDAK